MSERVNLTIKLIQAENLVAKDRSLLGLGKKTSSDPYVRVLWGNELLGKTPVIKRTLSPKWNSTFVTSFDSNEELEKAILKQPCLLLIVYDSDVSSKDDLMGIVSVPITLPELPLAQDESDAEEKDDEEEESDLGFFTNHSTDADQKITQWYDIPRHSAKHASGRIQISIKTTIDAHSIKSKRNKEKNMKSKHHEPNESSSLTFLSEATEHKDKEVENENVETNNSKEAIQEESEKGESSYQEQSSAKNKDKTSKKDSQTEGMSEVVHDKDDSDDDNDDLMGGSAAKELPNIPAPNGNITEDNNNKDDMNQPEGESRVSENEDSAQGELNVLENEDGAPLDEVEDSEQNISDELKNGEGLERINSNKDVGIVENEDTKQELLELEGNKIDSKIENEESIQESIKSQAKIIGAEDEDKGSEFLFNKLRSLEKLLDQQIKASLDMYSELQQLLSPKKSTKSKNYEKMNDYYHKMIQNGESGLLGEFEENDQVQQQLQFEVDGVTANDNVRNKLAPSKEPEIETRVIEVVRDVDLMKLAEEYVAADITMFAATDDAEVLKNLEELDNRAENPESDDHLKDYELPDPSSRFEGMFTSTILTMLYENMFKTDMTTRDTFFQLSNDLFHLDYKPSPILSSSRPDVMDKPFRIVPDNCTGEKWALLIGIVYKGQKGELLKSHDDVKDVASYLRDVQDFKDENIKMMMDDGESKEPTKKNIIGALRFIATCSQPGDVIFFYFAGHGTQIEDDDGDEIDGFDEAILPMDVVESGPIRDDDLFRLLIPMAKGVKMTCIFDCSHSGTALDLPFKFKVEGTAENVIFASEGDFSHLDTVRRMRRIMENPDSKDVFWEEMDNLNSHQAKVDYLCEQAQTYIAADVRMFSACEDGKEVEDLNSTDYFYIPDVVDGAGGAFTAAIIESSLALKDKVKTNREGLVRIRSSLMEKGYPQIPYFSSSRPLDIDETFRIVPDGCTGTLRALLVGINYIGDRKKFLRGSHNDVERMASFLTSMHGFQPHNIIKMMDDDSSIWPSRRNIMYYFTKLVEICKPGDVAFFHFSGHGGQIADQDGDEDDGFDETLIPVDGKHTGPIRDDLLFKKIVCRLPKGATMTCVFDCCNSGTMMDLPFVFSPSDKLDDILKDKPNFFPHMEFVKSLGKSYVVDTT